MGFGHSPSNLGIWKHIPKVTTTNAALQIFLSLFSGGNGFGHNGVIFVPHLGQIITVN